MRFVPWYNEAELQYIHDAIYAVPTSLDSQRFALQRLEAWMSRGSCSTNIESTAALLDAILIEQSSASLQAKTLRDKYALAIIRFVNNLVDPLQQSYYARSISSIALQLGLPLSFVEIRHAATHDSLPALPVLRKAAMDALSWLNQAYWIPLLHRDAHTDDSHQIIQSLQTEINDALRIYKVERKEVIRDVSKQNQSNKEMSKLLGNFDRMIQAATLFLDRDDPNSTPGVELLAESLLIVGGLVPTSKKKRKVEACEISQDVLELWHPLLDHLSDNYGLFSRVLLTALVRTLMQESHSLHPSQDESYMDMLCLWLVYLTWRFTRDNRDLQQQVLSAALISKNPRLQRFCRRFLQAYEQHLSPTGALSTLVSLGAPVTISQPTKELDNTTSLEDRLKAAELRWTQLQDTSLVQQPSQLEDVEERSSDTPWRLMTPAEFVRTPLGATSSADCNESLSLQLLEYK